MTGAALPGSPWSGGSSEDIVQVDVFGDGQTIGLVGLANIFERFYAQHRIPDPFVEADLVKLAAQQNYIPSEDEPVYRAALAREYVKFCYERDAAWLP